MEQHEIDKTDPLVHSITGSPMSTTMTTKTAILFFLGSIILGIIVGFGVTSFKKPSTDTAATAQDASSAGNTEVKKTVGVADKKAFPDKAEGVLREGGIEGEGTYHLERPGGESQNVYLTSSTVDMAPYVGKKVRVWGQTFSGQKAGWLMDVGLVEVLK